MYRKLSPSVYLLYVHEVLSNFHCALYVKTDKTSWTYGIVMPFEHVWHNSRSNNNFTIRPRSSDPLYIVVYYIKWVTTSWTDSKKFFIYKSY